ncbi:glutamate racemase [Sphingomicrobium astaxanthinifaciens]|uniref:glutamate racemase n=1 Tax=Sphingomicrobium astaxanthinifaciens TaxID=1227949 RepID=UPI001FCC99BC|nr:glutamate racemase [Sphingomicrobium astaxanthinifaciens]MCJ7422101.1 glutamate racemase [Sphingomicrobium astaxanthinifaciens]
MSPDAPLLFFDSGIGGLSILEPTAALLPNAPVVYAADTAAFPYGTRSEAEIAARVPALLGRLVERVRPRLVTIACNTASTIALDHVRAALDVPVVGTVPAIKPAAETSRSRVIGVLGTQATVRQPYVDDLAARFAADCTVLRHGSAALVELAEARLRGEPVDPAAVVAAAQPLFDRPGGERLDTVVLACTHFPLLADWLEQAHPHVAFIDGGAGIARRIAQLTRGQRWPAAAPPGRALFTGAVPDAIAPALRRFGIDQLGSL